MPAKNQDLHGSAPDKCENALLLIDVINDLDFPEGEQMLPQAREMAKKVLVLCGHGTSARMRLRPASAIAARTARFGL